MPKDKGLRDRDMRLQQLMDRKFEVQKEVEELDYMINNFNMLIDDEVEFSQMVDEWIDCPRMDSDEHPSVIFETGGGRAIPYFFTEYKQVFNHKPYPWRMSGYNWKVAVGVADECKRPLLHVEYCWDFNDDSSKYATFYVEAANNYAKQEFDKHSIPHQLQLSQYQMVLLSFVLRGKDKNIVKANKDKFSTQKNKSDDFWKGI
jgi:hypothetical protein